MDYGFCHPNKPDAGNALRIQGVIVALVHPSYTKDGRWQVVTDVHHRRPKQCEVDTQEQAERVLATWLDANRVRLIEETTHVPVVYPPSLLEQPFELR